LAQDAPEPGVLVEFEESPGAVLSDTDRLLVKSTAAEVAQVVRSLFPDFTDAISVSVVVFDRDLDGLGGVTGQAEAPGEVLIAISSAFPGGLGQAVRAGLRSVLLHEFHHLVRGWTIRENQFGPGIPTAVVNEGLAAVFADTYSGKLFEGYEYPENSNEWLEEILVLPLDADYNAWMNQHPDGRLAVGYRVGRYVVHEAIERSGQTILGLTTLSPDEILRLVMG
jgi:hypothetical protein